MPNFLKQIILRDGEFIFQSITEEHLGAQDAYIRSLMPPVSIFAPRLFSLNSGVHAMFTPQNTYFITELTTLPFRTSFIPNIRTKCLNPTFRVQPIDGEVTVKDNDFPWPEAWGKLWFIVNTTRGEGNYWPAECYLISTRDGECFHTNYPNVYHSSGSICMGREWQGTFPQHGFVTGLDAFSSSMTSFLTSAMNRDLVVANTSITYSRALAKPHKWLQPEMGRPNEIISNRVTELLVPYLLQLC